VIGTIRHTAHRLQRHTTNRACSRSILYDLRIHWTGIFCIFRCGFYLTLIAARQEEIRIRFKTAMTTLGTEMIFLVFVYQGRLSRTQFHRHATYGIDCCGCRDIHCVTFVIGRVTSYMMVPVTGRSSHNFEYQLYSVYCPLNYPTYELRMAF